MHVMKRQALIKNDKNNTNDTNDTYHFLPISEGVKTIIVMNLPKKVPSL